MNGRRAAGPRGAGAAAAVLVLALAACSGGSSDAPSASSSASSADGPMTAPPAASSAAPSAVPAGEVPPSPVTGEPLLQEEPEKADPPQGIDGLLAWDTTGYPGPGPQPGALGNEHVDAPVDYAVVPPVGGPHAPVWLNVGVYTQPVPSERAVHALEHGAVWITYRPDLPDADVAALAAFVEQQVPIPEPSVAPNQANRYVLMSPWADDELPSPVVISAWGYQLRVERPDDPRLQQFVDTFRNSAQYSPEYGSPVDGVPVLTGGVPAAAGPAVPNPEGAVG